MTKRIVLLLAVLAVIALAVVVSKGQNTSVVEDSVIFVNNHTGLLVEVLRIEEVTVQKTPLVTHEVVVYIFLSGPVDVRQGEQRFELNGFMRHYQAVNGSAREPPTLPLFFSKYFDNKFQHNLPERATIFSLKFYPIVL